MQTFLVTESDTDVLKKNTTPFSGLGDEMWTLETLIRVPFDQDIWKISFTRPHEFLQL